MCPILNSGWLLVIYFVMNLKEGCFVSAGENDTSGSGYSLAAGWLHIFYRPPYSEHPGLTVNNLFGINKNYAAWCLEGKSVLAGLWAAPPTKHHLSPAGRLAGVCMPRPAGPGWGRPRSPARTARPAAARKALLVKSRLWTRVSGCQILAGRRAQAFYWCSAGPQQDMRAVWAAATTGLGGRRITDKSVDVLSGNTDNGRESPRTQIITQIITGPATTIVATTSQATRYPSLLPQSQLNVSPLFPDNRQQGRSRR